MKKLILIILFPFMFYAQQNNMLLLFSDANNVYAVDLNGLDENMTKTSPVNLGMNGTNTITSLPRNSTFEDNATDWATNGTHVVSVDGTSKLTATYTGKIAASGAGDASTNYASLPADKYTTIVDGTKYTLQVQVRAVLADTDVTLVIGGKSKTFTAVDQTSEVLVYNFEATSNEVTQPIQIYLSQADDVFIDQVDISVAYDLTTNSWVNTNDQSAGAFFLSNYDIDGFDFAFTSAEKNDLILRATNGIARLLNNFAFTIGQWYLVSITINRTGSMIFYVNGVSKGTIDITGRGRINGTGALEIGVRLAAPPTRWDGLIGETQIIRGQILTTSEILTNYNRGLNGKNFVATGNEVAWYKFKGNTNATFLSDETGNNDLTGTLVTQADDQLTLDNYGN